MKHVDNGPPYPDEIVFVGVGAIYRLNSCWPKSENIAVLDRVVGDLNYVGKHRLCRHLVPNVRWFDKRGELCHELEPIEHVGRMLDTGEVWDFTNSGNHRCAT